MIWHWPQITMAALLLFGMGVSAARYGEQKRDKYDLADVVFAPALLAVILYFGGFWTGGVAP